MLRLVLALAVMGALAYWMLRPKATPPARSPDMPAEVTLPPLQPNAQAVQQIKNEVKRIENQNRAAMERTLQGVGR